MNILLFGKTGQVGWELQRALAPLGNLIALDVHSTDYCGDFSNPEGVAETVKKIRPDVIVNAAAHTAVDKAESEPEFAQLLNATSVEAIAKAANEVGAWVIHYSTDYVFPGTGEIPWQETDATAPLNVYGETKLAGELAIISAMPFNSIIIRTGWVYSEFGNNFVKTILNLATKSNTLDIVSDQIGTPTYAYDLANLILQIVGSKSFLENEKPTSIFHYSNEGKSSWYEFAKEVISISGINCHLNPINTEDYPLPAKRPKYSILSKKKISQEYALNIDHWKDALKACLQNL